MVEEKDDKKESEAAIASEDVKAGTKAEAPAEKTNASDAGAAEETVEVPAQFKKLVDEIEKMTVLELNELVKVLEKKFGVSAQAVAAPATGAGGGEGDDEEQSTFTAELQSAGDQKIAVIKAVKEVLALGLKEAKDLVDGAPSVLKEGLKKEEAGEMKKKIEEAGGSVELK